MATKRGLFATAALLACTNGAAATGEQLLTMMKDAKNAAGALVFITYIEGVSDTERFYAAVDDLRGPGRYVPPHACLPSDVQLPDQTSAVIDFIKENEQTVRHTYDGAGIVREAMRVRWPCNR